MTLKSEDIADHCSICTSCKAFREGPRLIPLRSETRHKDQGFSRKDMLDLVIIIRDLPRMLAKQA